MITCRSNKTIYMRADAEKKKDDDQGKKEKQDFSFFLFRLSHPHVT